MTQLQAEIPDPLAHDTPYLLTARGMAAPTIGVLLAVFVSQRRLKCATMQVHLDDIGDAESVALAGS
jgi:hypothetical protein